MTKRKPNIPDFSGLVIEDQHEPPPPAAPVVATVAPQIDATAQPARPRRGKPPKASGKVKEDASPVLVYLDPAGHKALKLYAVESGRKVHDLMLEAVEEWARKRGVREPMRLKGSG